MARVFLVWIVLGCCQQLWAQEVLPKFSVATRGGSKIFISWTNNYPTVNQISIQRSIDSTRNFKTLLTVPDPSVLQNGFVDTKASTLFMFYRLFIVLDSGNYVFSASKRPFWDTARTVVKKPERTTDPVNNKQVQVSDTLDEKVKELLKETLQGIKQEEIKPAAEEKPEPEKFYFIKRRDSLLLQVAEKDFKKFRDSLVYKTKDTIVFKSLDTIVIKQFVPKEVYKPSIYVFTTKDGNLSISLPESSFKNYSIKFFEEDASPLFEVRQVKENSLILDKSNFLHSGWFRFELYEDGKLKEKNKFYIPREF